MVKKLVKETILKNNLIEKGDCVIVGLSGGPDSVCLFSILLELRDELDISISAVHVNHMFRHGDAESDQTYVKAMCENAEIPCEIIIRDCAKIAKEQGLTFEEAGRNIRYEAFYESAKKLIANGIKPRKIKIAVAQNKNDQAETLLMRIMRGTGVSGLSGIEYMRSGEHGTSIIRPLLDVDRISIEDYCAEKNLNPCIDHTNDEALYTRNKIRLELIPYMEKNFNENIINALIRLTQSAKEDDECLWEQAQKAYCMAKRDLTESGVIVNSDESIVLDRAMLTELNPAIRKRVVLAAFYETGLMQDITASHLEAIDDIIFSDNASAKTNLPSGYVMSVSYENAIFFCENLESTHHAKIEFKKNVKVIAIEDYKEESYNNSAKHEGRYVVAFDYEKLEGTLENPCDAIEIRSREQGDYFTPQGMKSGRKKIQDYFVDRKIPKENRELYKLATLGKEVIWVFDPVYNKHNEISEKYKVAIGTKRVLVLEIEKET